MKLDELLDFLPKLFRKCGLRPKTANRLAVLVVTVLLLLAGGLVWHEHAGPNNHNSAVANSNSATTHGSNSPITQAGPGALIAPENRGAIAIGSSAVALSGTNVYYIQQNVFISPTPIKTREDQTNNLKRIEATPQLVDRLKTMYPKGYVLFAYTEGYTIFTPRYQHIRFTVTVDDVPLYPKIDVPNAWVLNIASITLDSEHMKDVRINQSKYTFERGSIPQRVTSMNIMGNILEVCVLDFENRVLVAGMK